MPDLREDLARDVERNLCNISNLTNYCDLLTAWARRVADAEADARLGRELVAILTTVAGDGGETEGAAECARRVIRERDAARRDAEHWRNIAESQALLSWERALEPPSGFDLKAGLCSNPNCQLCTPYRPAAPGATGDFTVDGEGVKRLETRTDVEPPRVDSAPVTREEYRTVVDVAKAAHERLDLRDAEFATLKQVVIDLDHTLHGEHEDRFAAVRDLALAMAAARYAQTYERYTDEFAHIRALATKCKEGK